MFKSERHELLFHEHLQLSNTIAHGFCRVTANKGYWRHFKFLRVVFVISNPVPRVFSAWTCDCFLNKKTFGWTRPWDPPKKILDPPRAEARRCSIHRIFCEDHNANWLLQPFHWKLWERHTALFI